MTDTNELTVRLRAEADLPHCVEALAGVQAADRYPVDRPADPADWLTPHGMTDAWVVVAGADVVGHMALTPPGPALATAAGLPERSLLAVARLFVSTRARRRGVAALLLDRAIETGAARGPRPVLEVETAASAAIGLYERAGWRHVGTSTADWTTADGRLARMRVYVAPAVPMDSSRSSHF
ncbi:GNAT family N-acetyltransferase [Streptomyces sp. NPDC059893]|uniref:GNAT family N-acetyltransferase n=1 Tax=Streptomyces sp. NPDC059893 TaxID=3346990 RepID=UPI0036567E95